MAEYVADPPLSKMPSLTPHGDVRGKIKIWVKDMSKVRKIVERLDEQIVINNDFIRKYQVRFVLVPKMRAKQTRHKKKTFRTPRKEYENSI